jgi:hypothetical protein
MSCFISTVDMDDDEHVNTTLLSLVAGGSVISCCLEIKGTIVRRNLIDSYYLQDTAMCNIKAVM